MNRVLQIAGAATLISVFTATVAYAGPTATLSNITDDLFNSTYRTPGYEKWVAEGRIGDRGGAATYESSVQTVEGSNGNYTNVVKQQQQVNWGNGTDNEFSVKKQGNTVTFNIAGTSSTWNGFQSNVSDLFLRVRAGGQPSNILLNNLSLQQSGNTYNFVPTLSATAPNSNGVVNYLQISGIDATQDFTLTGIAKFSWTGTEPRNSNLAFQVKAVPEASTMVSFGLLLAPLGYGLLRRRKSLRNI